MLVVTLMTCGEIPNFIVFEDQSQRFRILMIDSKFFFEGVIWRRHMGRSHGEVTLCAKVGDVVNFYLCIFEFLFGGLFTNNFFK